jgi:hypothetical protein
MLGMQKMWRLWGSVSVLIGGFVLSGCGGSGVSQGQGSEEDGGDEGGADNPTSGALTLDEAGLVASLGPSLVNVRVPVRANDGADARGQILVSVRKLGAQGEVFSKSAKYDIEAGKQVVLDVAVAVENLPTEQPELALWSVRAEEDSKSGARVTKSLLYAVPPYEVRLEGPRNLTKDRPASYRVRATNPVNHLPMAGVDVGFTLARDGAEIESLSGTTEATGEVVFEIAPAESGSYEVSARGESGGVPAAVDDEIEVAELDRKLLLTTDKPIYQPGQVIHLRALALERPALGPVSAAEVTFEVEDGKGNKVYKEPVQTDDYGIAHSTFKIGNVVNMGTYTVRAVLGSTQSQKTVEVSQYVLPKFRVAVTTDKPWYRASETVVGTVSADYFFGKDVAGANVKLEALTLDIGETVFREINGTTDAEGSFAFSVKLPPSLVGLPLEQGRAIVTLRVGVTDSAEQLVEVERAVIVANADVDVTLVPEAGALVPGVENRLLAFVADPLGSPVSQVALTLEAGDYSAAATTDTFGQAEFVWSGEGSPTFELAATLPGGGEATQSFSFANQPGKAHVLVRTDAAVYDVGASASVEITVDAAETHVYVDWLNNGQVVDMRTLEVANGTAEFSMELDTAFLGSNRVEAYVVDLEGNVIRAGKTLFVRNESGLEVTLQTDKPLYAPGEKATLTFAVTDEEGAPTVAALGVQIVDEAVFSLIDARPGLLRTYFELEDAFAVPQYQIKGPVGSLSSLLFEETASGDANEAAAAQARTEATFAALGGTSILGVQAASWPETVAAGASLLTPVLALEKTRLLPAIQKVVDSTRDTLAAEGCTAAAYWCEGRGQSYGQALSSLVAAEVAAWDLWGNAYVGISTQFSADLLRLLSLGPDEVRNTGDDQSMSFSYYDFGLEDEWNVFPGGEDGGGGEFGEGGIDEEAGDEGSEGPTEGGESSEDGDGPRVRREFPETLYVNPALITGPDGKATVELDMADSITEWRVSSLAHSAAGRLGGGASGITVFQEFFVDIAFPATLTRGDEVSFPIAIYNYLDTPQAVTVSMQPAPWFEALGATEEVVQLAPGQVLGTAFPVRVNQVGLHTLTVVAMGSDKSDAVARSVRVVPDGVAVPENFSGALAPGSVTHTVSFPPNAVEGSGMLWLDVYPAFLSQAVSGMESMLQVPNGCFEQTTSTTWPNVLVTDYMDETGQITPEIRLQAESLISAGYQRLLTFEHPGGGFSWFGTSDPAPFLSVTAFGLMEFVDMSEVYPVDPDMIARTRNWIVSQQKPDGSWPGDVSEFFTFHTSTVRNTAFVLWALGTAGYEGSAVGSALAYIKANLGNEPIDAYTKGLLANALGLVAPSDPLLSQLLAELEAAKQTDGDKVFWSSGDSQTPFYESGDSADISATAMVVLAMMQAGGYKASVDGGIEYLLSKKDALGNWNSTQATIWTLRALLMAAKKGSEGATGTLDVTVDGALVQTLALTPEKWDVMFTVDLAQYAITGSHDVELEFAGMGRVSYNLGAQHHVPWEAAPATGTGVLSIDLSYDKTTLTVNDTATATVNVKNNTDLEQNMVLVTLGVPPGFAVLTEALEASIEAGELSRYEITGKQLTLYISKLPGGATLTYTYGLLATMPVKSADGGASASLYYEPEEESQAASTTLTASESL